MEFTLTKNQQRVFDLVESSNRNLLIMGKPGVGKSVLIRALTEAGQKNYILAAPTGLAALNIGGRTLHSIFRLPTSEGIISESYDMFPTDDATVNFIRFAIKYLIIDEISMVRADTFDYIDRLLRYIKDQNEPFGGVQIIAIGDFFQLPPVVTSQEKIQLKKADYDSPFVFHSKAFKEGNFNVVQLNEVLRQAGDPEFMELLDVAREGVVENSHITILNKRVNPLEGVRISLVATNKEAATINLIRLKSLGTEIRTYEARVFGHWPAYPTEVQLQLAVGAQIMVKMNRADVPDNVQHPMISRVVNGTLGIVKELEKDRVLITVTEKGQSFEAWIYTKTNERKKKVQNEDGKWSEEVVASFRQVPLSLAWAISIHKSQGQTFSEVHINASKIFADGQFYVALSRCKTLDGITLESPVSPRKFTTNKHVLKFNDQYA